LRTARSDAGLVQQQFLPGVNNLGVWALTPSQAAVSGTLAGGIESAAKNAIGTANAANAETQK